MLILYRFGAAADQQHQHGRTEEEYDGEMQVVDSAYEERALRRENATARAKPELRQHPTQTHRKTAYQAPESTLEVKTDGKSCMIWNDIIHAGGCFLTVSLTLLTNTAIRKTEAIGGDR